MPVMPEMRLNPNYKREAEFATPLGLQTRARRLEHIHRRGLDESLQQFAKRLGGRDAKPDNYRHSWALQGLRFLGAVPLTETWEQTVERIGEGARIAPGVSVFTPSVNL